MYSQKTLAIPVFIRETVADEIYAMFDQITKHADEVAQGRTVDLDDWLAAERDLLVKPEVHIEHNGRAVTVFVRLCEISPAELKIFLTSDAMLIQGQHAASPKKIFRTVQFPKRIDADKAEARYEDECVILIAPGL